MVVDPSAATGDEVAHHLIATGQYQVTCLTDPLMAAAHARASAADPPLIAVVHLRFPEHPDGGLDVLRAFARWCPESALVVRPDCPCDRPRLAAARAAHQALSVIPADVLWPELLTALDAVARTGLPRVDARWRTDPGS